jgi:glyoxylase-like metal-dependent hydrolase (beta-lactamase superfamily II)
MIFRQLFDADTCTYTYLIADSTTKRGIIVDSVLEQFERDLNLIKELGIELVYSLDTHVHADHITAAAKLRQATGCKIAYSAMSKVTAADELINDNQVIEIDGLKLKALATPGHTDCSMCYLVNNELLLTGDTLLIRGCGRTDFQQGNAAGLYENVTKKLFTLPDSTKVYPAHNYQGMTMSTIGEEKAHNPRFVGKTKAEFIELMNNLNMPKPRRMDEAVPANLQCGVI